MKLDCKRLVKISKDKYQCPTLYVREMSKKQAEVLCHGCVGYSLDIDYGGNVVDIPDDELMNMRRIFAEFEAVQERLKELYESA